MTLVLCVTRLFEMGDILTALPQEFVSSVDAPNGGINVAEEQKRFMLWCREAHVKSLMDCAWTCKDLVAKRPEPEEANV